MEIVFQNHGMTCKVIATAFPAGKTFGLALVRLCDGQSNSNVVCTNLQISNVDGQSVGEWGHGHYFGSMFDAKKYFTERLMDF